MTTVMSASILIDGEPTESFEVKITVKQGCVIALIIIIITIIIPVR